MNHNNFLNNRPLKNTGKNKSPFNRPATLKDIILIISAIILIFGGLVLLYFIRGRLVDRHFGKHTKSWDVIDILSIIIGLILIFIYVALFGSVWVILL